MDGPWPALVVLGLLFVGLVAYHLAGGVGGLAGRVSARLAAPSAPSPVPRPGAWSGHLPARVAGDGTSRAAAMQALAARFADDLWPVEVQVSELVPALIPPVSLARLGVALGEDLATLKRQRPQDDALATWLADTQAQFLRHASPAALTGARFCRTLRDFREAERAGLRLAELLTLLGQMDPLTLLRVRAALAWNEGKTELRVSAPVFLSADRLVRVRQALGDALLAHCGPPVAALERVQASLRAALAPDSRLHPAERDVLAQMLVTGAAWLTPSDASVPELCRDPASPSVLRLGVFPGTTTDLLYDRRESLATFAMPGAGKSLALVLRNLLHSRAPAVVLDVKGELAAASAAWRAANVGPVYVFAPRDPARSVRFNPFTRVSTDPATAWEDADRLAALLAVPTTNSAAGESYWDRRGRRLLGGVLLEVALSETGAARSMAGVRARLARIANKSFLRKEYAPRLAALKVPDLLDLAHELMGLSDDQLPGVVDTARGYIQQWASPRIVDVTEADSFRPEALRAENATLYLNVELEDVRRYASVLRAIIGQTLGHLVSGQPDRQALPVTFFLDEFPQLGRFDEIARALDLGRGFGVRFWLFAQSIHHLRETYANAEGMLGSCYLRSFINPTDADALWLSRQLGERHGLLDGERKPLAEASDLAGARFADKLVCFLARGPNAVLDTVNAYADPICRQRMGL